MFCAVSVAADPHTHTDKPCSCVCVFFHLQVFWKVWTCMSSRGNDCLKLYVTEVFFFWKIFVT